MRSMSSLEYRYIVQELQLLVGKRFRKFYFIRGNLYRMRIGDADIVCEPGIRLHLTKYLEESEGTDNLTQKIRKELENAKLLAIRQLNNDRVIVFEFVDGLSLYFEMFAKGNIILVREDKTIVALRNENWADREIKPNAEYKPPKASVVDSLKDAISDKYIISCMMRLPLGKQYALEMLASCNIPEKTPGTQLAAEQLKCIEDKITEIEKTQKPILFLKNGKPAEYGLVPFSGYSGTKETKTLSEVVDWYYSVEQEQHSEEVEKLERRLVEQEKRLQELHTLEKELRVKGDYIYGHYQELDAAAADARQNPKKYRINQKEKTVEIEG